MGDKSKLIQSKLEQNREQLDLLKKYFIQNHFLNRSNPVCSPVCLKKLGTQLHFGSKPIAFEIDSDQTSFSTIPCKSPSFENLLNNN